MLPLSALFPSFFTRRHSARKEQSVNLIPFPCRVWKPSRIHQRDEEAIQRPQHWPFRPRLACWPRKRDVYYRRRQCHTLVGSSLVVSESVQLLTIPTLGSASMCAQEFPHLMSGLTSVYVIHVGLTRAFTSPVITSRLGLQDAWPDPVFRLLFSLSRCEPHPCSTYIYMSRWNNKIT